MSEITSIHRVREGVEIIFEEERGITKKTFVLSVVINEEQLDKINKEMEKNLKITEKEISDLRTAIEEDDIIDNIIEENLELLKELKKISSDDYINKAKLYFKCYTILKELKENLVSSKKIYLFIKNIPIDKTFEDDIEYLKSGNFGNHYTGLRIKDYVMQHKEDINTVIDLFFKIFGDE